MGGAEDHWTHRWFLMPSGTSSTVDARAYLERLGNPPVPSPDAAALARLHRAHLLHVPFENLDIHLGREIRLDVDAFFEKVVTGRRGGFCYELNALFAALLEALGYRVTLVAARVAGDDGVLGPDFAHLALLVHLEDDWLADVGFGDSFLEPLRLREGEQQVAGHQFRLSRADGAWLLDRWAEGAWTLQYAFTPRARTLPEFAPMCHFMQTSPDSIFTQKRVCTRATPGGRLTLRGGRLIETRGSMKVERGVCPEEADTLLVSAFGMHPGTRWPRDAPENDAAPSPEAPPLSEPSRQP